MGGVDTQISFRPDGQKLWPLLAKIHHSKATGVLTVDWEKFKKQIVFKTGEPIVVRSNVPDETFVAYLMRQKVFEAFQLKSFVERKQAENDKSPFPDWLVKNNLLNISVLPSLLQGFFKERMIQVLHIKIGNALFNSVTDTNAYEPEAQKLDESFAGILWKEIQPLYSDKMVLARIGGVLAELPKWTADFPFALTGKDLKAFNETLAKEKTVADMSLEAKRFLAIGMDFEIVQFQDIHSTPISQETFAETIAEIIRREAESQKALAHEILGVTLESSVEDCRAAYYELVRRFHPDRLTLATPEQKAFSESLFIRINSAFSTLTDPDKRSDYIAQVELDKAGGVEAIQKQIEAEFMIPQAQQALKRRHYQGALELYRKISEVIRDDPEILAEYAYAEMMVLSDRKNELAARASEFESRLKRALEIRPKFGFAAYCLGILHKAIGSMQIAALDFERALEIDPSLAEAASELRLIHMRQKKK